MNILVLNSGSSSIKFQLFDIKTNISIANGIIENIGEKNSLGYINIKNKKIVKNTPIISHKIGLEIINQLLEETNILTQHSQLAGIGHRVVHGGEKFIQPIIITNKVIKQIQKLIPLAPLHNNANIQGIKSAIKHFAHIPQIAVFDTAFHMSIPKTAYIYPIPYKYYQQHHIRRYGFHGTSHQYVAQQCATYLKKDLSKLNIISLHLGNGASVCAIKNGKSIDTSMGFTPLEGLMMGTRSGNIDPAIIPYLANNFDLTVEQIDNILNQQSGLKGICNTKNMKEIELLIKKDKYAKLAFDMFCYRIKKYIGEYYAVLGRVDCIIFTGGIGENSMLVREHSCSNLENLGISLSKKLNKTAHTNIAKISKKSSKTVILKIATNEELQIALEVKKLL